MSTILFYLIKMLILAPLGALVWGLLRPWRQYRLAHQNMQAGPYRECILLLLFVFMSGLLGLTLTPIGFWNGIFHFLPFQGDINLIPFHQSWALLCYYASHGMWKAILINFSGNIIIFMPIGFFSGLLMAKPCWWKSTLSAFFLSLFIEIFQLFVSRGTDVDDLILNALGGLMGHWLFLLLRKKAPLFVQKCAKLQKGGA